MAERVSLNDSEAVRRSRCLEPVGRDRQGAVWQFSVADPESCIRDISDMKFEVAILLNPFMLFIGAMTMGLIALVLGLMRNRTRFWIGLAGALAGYITLGTKYAYELDERARAAGTCPDAAWGGPSKGALIGAAVAVVAYEILRRFRSRGGADGSPTPDSASG